MAFQHKIVEKMEQDSGKLFIGGISWDTDEDGLKAYFSQFGEVVEAVIMRDRLTGRARGFGFVVYAEPVVAARVVLEKHIIHGRTVEAKKAVPRDRNNGSIQRSPSPGPVGRTKKIFVGGLASTVTENDFKKYFDQFGSITDVVVMYNQNTQKQRGFGFITYDSEESVDRVLHKTFHELKGKMVEVKRAVPKDSSPGSTRIGYKHGSGRPNTIGGYPQGFGVEMDSRLSPMADNRTGFSPFGSSGYGIEMNLESLLSPGGFGGTGYGRVLSPYYGGNSNRYTTPIGYNQSNNRNESVIGASTRSLWGNSELNNGASWGSSPMAGQGRGSSSGHFNGVIGGFSELERKNGAGFVATRSSFNENLFHGDSMYGHETWQSSSNEIDHSAAFGYGFDNAEEFIGNYGIANRQPNRGIAA